MNKFKDGNTFKECAMDDKTNILNFILQILKNEYEFGIPFNRMIQLKITHLTPDDVMIKIQSREELYGNYKYHMLHGGVIAAVLDVTGGVIASLAALKRVIDKSPEEIKETLYKVSTINLNINYISPGKGEYFLATGKLVHAKNKVAYVHLYLHNNKEQLISTASGAYTIG